MISRYSSRVRRWGMFLIALAMASFAWAQHPSNQGHSSASHANMAADDVPSAQVIQPEELAQALKGPEKPVVLYVGPKAFYAQAHIPGAENVGPVGKPEGMEKLRARAASLPKDRPVVIYCGCCPWDHCPNIRPAFAELKKEGFTKLKVLYLATSFGVNWKDKGLAVATGE